MGVSFSKKEDTAALKFQAHSITPFSGGYEEWNVWKSRTEYAFNGSGYEKILSSKKYSEENQDKNKIVYSQLSVATVDGTAYHLVRNHDDSKDGHKSWTDLCEWYDGDEVRTEAAENARSKLEALTLGDGGSASDYVNKFLNYYRYLEKIPGESYSKSHAIQRFLAGIKDKNFQATVSFCRNDRLPLDECVSRVRANERELSRKRREERRIRGVVRKLDNEYLDEENESSRRRKIRRISDNENLVLFIRDSGRIGIDPKIWKSLGDDIKTFVKDYNAAVSHNEDPSKISIPSKVELQKVRRTQKTTNNIKNNY